MRKSPFGKAGLATAVVLIATVFAGQVRADCPDYLDQTMRKLHSKDSINLCESFAGKPMLIVNTASHCGFTPQFKDLEALHQRYAPQGLVIVGFASNDFNQEAKDEGKAAEVCFVNNGVTFTMLAPTHVLGEQANPVFQQLNAQSTEPKWNFNKYLVNKEGVVVQHFGSRTSPQSEEMVTEIEKLL
jgi:glutathione peroxidase